MLYYDLDSTQTARFIVNACSHDKSLNFKIIMPIVEIDKDNYFITRDYIPANLYLLQQNMSMAEIKALNWFVKFNDNKMCHFEDLITVLAEKANQGIKDVCSDLKEQLGQSHIFDPDQYLEPKLSKNDYSLQIAEMIVQECLNNSNCKTYALKPYFELTSQYNLNFAGFIQANTFHYAKNISRTQVYTLNWFITTDNDNVCYFQDFIDQAKSSQFKFNIINLKA
tara:strand:- start:697 stop:1368 length:672 start_codon:yes stop_codon:yes gene_type:complete